jgi:hypothetical protein
VFLHEQISELELKKADLERELNSNDTPEEHRAQLIEQIRRNNEDITHIQQQ